MILSHSYCVTNLCITLGCSQRHLYDVFMRDIGLPPKTWMNHERMVVARRKLEGGKPVEDVATDLGFASVDSFRRRFFNTHQVSPQQFQRERKIFNPSRRRRE